MSSASTKQTTTVSSSGKRATAAPALRSSSRNTVNPSTTIKSSDLGIEGQEVSEASDTVSVILISTRPAANKQIASALSTTSSFLMQTTLDIPSDITAEFLERLKSDAFYLGDRAMVDNVAWAREGKADKLVLPDKESTYAVLSCIAEIDTDSYWLTSDANFRGENSYVKKLMDAKATCMMMKPTMEFFSGEWESVLANLRNLMGQIAKSGTTTQGLFAMQTSMRFKVRHVLFSLKDDNEEEEGAALGKDFTLAGWHVVSDAAKGCLEEMILEDKYTVHPLLAYDVFGNIINPKDYRKMLAGATVELRFRLTHYTIAKRGDDGRQIKGETIATFVADIEQLRVLITPKVVSSPSKRKISAQDPATRSAKRGKQRAL